MEAKIMNSFSTINSVKSDAHSFRVTLTLLRKSTVCPIEVGDLIDTLVENNWNRKTLNKLQWEILYTHLDNDLCAAALSEWDVETHRMRDWGFPFWRSDYKEWWDGQTRKVDCRLCGHRDNRYEFPLVNVKNNEEIWTGSTCIVKYGVTVDGEACAEEALGKLRAIMGKSKKAQTRHEWRAAHPDSDAVIAKIEEALPVCNAQYITWRIKKACDDDGTQILPWNFDSQRRLLGKWARATVKYYKKNGYLTPQRTDDIYVSTGKKSVPNGAMARTAAEIRESYDRAKECSGGKHIREFWENFIAEHPHMTTDQKDRILIFKERNQAEWALYRSGTALVEKIRTQHAEKEAELNLSEKERTKRKKAKDKVEAKASETLKKCPWL